MGWKGTPTRPTIVIVAVAPVGAEAVLEPDRGPGGGKESEPATHRIIHSTHVSGLHPRQKRKHPYRTYIDRPSRQTSRISGQGKDEQTRHAGDGKHAGVGDGFWRDREPVLE